MTNIHEKEPIVPYFVDMGQSVLLAVSYGDSGLQRFIKDDIGRLVSPTGVYGLSYFSIEEIVLKIRYLSTSEDDWLRKTGESLQNAFDGRFHLHELSRKNIELVFCLIYPTSGDKYPLCGFTLIPVRDTAHLAGLEADAVSHGDSYYCFLRKINDPISFSVKDTRHYLIRKFDGSYLRDFKNGEDHWTTRRNKAAHLTRLRAKSWLRRLRNQYPGTMYRMVQFITKPLKNEL